MGLDLLSPYAHLSDDDLNDYEDRDTLQGLTDATRIRYARARLANQLREAEVAVETVHAWPVRHTEGAGALLCGIARSRGQAGPEFEWHGVFVSLNQYLDWLPSRGLIHEDDLSDLTDAQILAAWRRR